MANYVYLGFYADNQESPPQLEDWDPDERDAYLEFFEEGVLYEEVSDEKEICAFCGEELECHVLKQGARYYPKSLIHYISEHNVKPPSHWLQVAVEKYVTGAKKTVKKKKAARKRKNKAKKTKKQKPLAPGDREIVLAMMRCSRKLNRVDKEEEEEDSTIQCSICGITVPNMTWRLPDGENEFTEKFRHRLRKHPEMVNVPDWFVKMAYAWYATDDAQEALYEQEAPEFSYPEEEDE